MRSRCLACESHDHCNARAQTPTSVQRWPMTNSSRKIIMDALKEYKSANLASAAACRRIVDGPMTNERARGLFEEQLRLDDDIHRAMEEIAVAQ